MRILLVSHGIPTAQDPQWGGFERDQALALTKLGHKVIIAAIDGRYRRFHRKRGVSRTVFGAVPAYLLYLFPLRLILNSNLRREFRARMMEQLFFQIIGMEGAPDIICAHYLFSMEALDRVRKKFPAIPVVGMEHWSKLSGGNLMPDVQVRGKRVYGQLDRLLVVSERLQEEIRRNFGIESVVVHDMVGDLFLQYPVCENRSNRRFRFVSVASLVAGKGFDLLIRALSRIQDQDAELVIIGDGPLRERLMQLCRELKIEDRVTFKGLLSPSEVAENISEGNAYVLASRSETFGVSYVEALAMGRPVVATRCGGPESFMTDACGLLVDVDDLDALVSAMDRMEQEVHQYDSEKMREYIRSRFAGEVIAKELESIFKDVICNKQVCIN